MSKPRLWTALILAVPLVVLPAACGDGAEEQRSALEEDELERELDLALRGDTAQAALEDTEAPAPEPKPEPRAETPRRRTQPRPEPRPETRPEPREAPPEPAPRPTTLTVPTGTTFAARLNETLSTDSSQVGDPFTATISDPIVDGSGTVLIPAGAVVHGRVTATDKSDHVGETAVIKLAFESVSFGGHSYPLQGTVVEAEVERRTRTTTAESAAKVAAGAAAGAILGQVLGKDTESTLKGAVAGAAAGTAVALGTKDVDAVMASGSRMVIRLDAPIQVQRSGS